jgi:hypothetical protein
MAASAHELVKQWDSECRTCEARANEGTKRHHEPLGCIYDEDYRNMFFSDAKLATPSDP